MKWIALLFIFLNSAHAMNQNDAFNSICLPLPSFDDRLACLDRIKAYTFFDEGALNVCKTIQRSNEQINCLDDIGGKSFQNFELAACTTNTYYRLTMACLKSNGTVEVGPCTVNSNLVGRLDGIVARFTLDDKSGGLQLLKLLRDEMKTCF